ncbi:MAG TPA: FG-GAP-like repeat-containing protein [Myxococcales bacterium]|nr:FG-GAP-like repeat-containing protein [Myxococcales bacterium]
MQTASVETTPARSRIDARIVLIGLVIAVICGIFWLGSRYPALQSKAGADPDEALSTPLGFEAHFPEPRADEKGKRVLWVAAEWAITNKQGMTFGILLAAAFLTLIPLLPRPRGGKFAGSLKGLFIGAPLGVCVNCAAPIGQAMLRGGSTVETALATMFASPSFNVIVLGMLLTLFPWYLAALKVATSLIMALIVVPQLSKLSERPGWRHTVRAAAQPPGLRIFQWMEGSFTKMSDALLTPAGDAPKGLFHALGWVLMRYGKNLWTVIRLSLPLMALAGLFGAVIVEFLPWSHVAQIAQVDGFWPNALVLLVVATFGTLLPVPIAFDVVVCAVLWNAGVPMYVVATLLVTLALYSVYAASLIGTTLSWRIAAVAGVAVLVLGLIAGSIANVVFRWEDLRTVHQAAALLEEIPAPKAPPMVLPAGRSAADLRGLPQPLPAASQVWAANGLTLTSAPFLAPSANASGKIFTRIDGASAGFERLPMPRPYLMMQTGPMHQGGIAVADLNGDGWPDVAVATNYGVFLYLNLGGGRFAQQAVDFPAMKDWLITVVALVDLDGDGAPDLFFCGWGQGCHILFNRDGDFSAKAHVELPRGEEVAITSVAFADIDRDGKVDIVTGASTSGPRFFYPAPAVNRIWHNRGGGKFEPEVMPGPEGDTLTLLFTDLNGDGWPDLYVGNDFDEPDRVFLNDKGTLRPVKAAGSPFPRSTNTTMSADSADLKNDGHDEVYLGQIAMGTVNQMAQRLSAPVGNCEIYPDLAERARCDTAARFQVTSISAWNLNDIDPCLKLPDATQQRDCVVISHHWFRVLARLPSLGADKAEILEECAKIPKDFTAMVDVCAAVAKSPMDHEQSDVTYADEMPQMKHSNLLFAPGEKGFSEITNEWHAGFGGWTWNAKFADLDNDTWQDLYISQGSRLRPGSVSATFYRNQEGTTFKEETKSFGLEDHVPTGAYVYADFDADGDLDIITHPFQLTPVIFRNDAPKGPGFQLSLNDRSSQNRQAIGARIEIKSADGRKQEREIKASGGYQSFDAPLAFFGLGNWPAVESISVRWPNGESSVIGGVKLGPGRYTLTKG